MKRTLRRLAASSRAEAGKGGTGDLAEPRRKHVRSNESARRTDAKGLSQGNRRCGRRARSGRRCGHDRHGRLACARASACGAGGAHRLHLPPEPLHGPLFPEVHGEGRPPVLDRTERRRRVRQALPASPACGRCRRSSTCTDPSASRPRSNASASAA